MEFGFFSVTRLTLFLLFTVLFIIFSWRPLHNPKHHGFYRFFVFEGTLTLVLLNFPFWFQNPLSPLQLVSWTFLFSSILFVVQGFYILKKSGGSGCRVTTTENLHFENTVNLVMDGLYKHIRHPMYSSLLLLAWGAFMKHITVCGFLTVLITTAFLAATAKTEEQENLSFFGSRYEEYIKGTKMFIPFLL